MILNLYPYQLNALQEILEENNTEKIPEKYIYHNGDLLTVHLSSEMAENTFCAILLEAMRRHH